MSKPFTVEPQTLGQRLVQARKAARVTQEQAAKHLGCSRPTLIAIEKGTRAATSEEIVKLAELYGRSVHELVRPGPPASPLEPHLRAAVAGHGAACAGVEEAIRALQDFANDYRRLQELTGASGPREFPSEITISGQVPLRDLAEDIAIRERGRLHLGDQPVIELRTLIEAAGVHVFYWELASGIAGLYVMVPNVGYCMLINRKHPPERRRWTLAHEYAHFLCDRHKPGIDYVSEPKRRTQSERFADALAASLLMPETGVRRHFLAVMSSTGDFQTADLCRLANAFHVSIQAMTFRLEELALLPKGTWNLLQERGFKPGLAKATLLLETPEGETGDPWPAQYLHLAVRAYLQEQISEGQLAAFLRTDRVSARELVLRATTSRDVDDQGNELRLELAAGESLLKLAAEG